MADTGTRTGNTVMPGRTPGGVTIRRATADDARALVDLYRPYVEQTAISFELDTPDVADFARCIAATAAHWGWLVAERDGAIAGYAYGSAHRAREAYRGSVENSAYVAAGIQRQRIASALYAELLEQLRALGYRQAYAGITLPNPASVRFHTAFRFEHVGTFPKVGMKFGRSHDVAWYRRPIDDER